MSLPTTRILPPVPDFENVENAQKYLHDLTFELQNMYEVMTQNINGVFRNNGDVDGSSWIPTVKGGTVAGTVTYAYQNGYVHRAGLLTSCWFNLEWTTIGGATGELILDLPYKVTKGFSAVAAKHYFTGSAGTGLPGSTWSGRSYVGNFAEEDTFNLKFEAFGSGLTAFVLPIQATMFVLGNITYIGVEDE